MLLLCLPMELQAVLAVVFKTDCNFCYFGTLPVGRWMYRQKLTHLHLELCRGWRMVLDLHMRNQSNGVQLEADHNEGKSTILQAARATNEIKA